MATVLIAGNDEPIPGVVSDCNYWPTAGDRVWLDVTDGDILITGRQGNSPAVFAAASWAEVATLETRGDTDAYGALATAGPAVTVLIGESGRLQVTITAEITGTDSSDGGSVGVDLSGANTVAAADNRALRFQPRASSARACVSRVVLFSGLTPGSTTATLVYKDLSGTSVNYAQREILALPF